MGTLEIDDVTYLVDSRALASLREALATLFQAQPSVDVVITFSDADRTVRIGWDSSVNIELDEDTTAGVDGAGLLTSEFLMMGRIRLNGLGMSPGPAA